MNYKKNLLAKLFAISILFAVNGCTTYNRWRSMTPVLVSGPIEISSEWIEVVPPTPLVSQSGTDQEILLYTERDVNDNGGKDWKTLKLKDGRTTKIEAFLYGDEGKEYELFINGDGGGATWLARLSPQDKKMVHFPNGRYVKLKIRSEIPIKVEKIEWKAGYAIDQL